MQWRARAVGEKSAAAEAKLDRAGPFEGMTVRRAMAVVLGVLKETLGDDFSVDRLEMACVDLRRTCGTGVDGDGEGSGDAGGAGGSVSGGEAGGRSSSDPGGGGGGAGSSDGGVGPSVKDAASAAPETGSDAGSGNRNSARSDGNGAGGGVLEETGSRNTGDGPSSSGASPSSAADYFVPRYGYFRRVPQSEMEELLAEGSASGDSAAGTTGSRSSE